MLLRRVYMMFLEHPGPGLMFVSGIGTTNPSLKNLDFFIAGYMESLEDLGVANTDWMEFHNWLIANNHFPSEGWAQKIIEEVGDGITAYECFRGVLFQYLETQIPNWFREFNSEARQSRFYNLNLTEDAGDHYRNHSPVPRLRDVRIPKHIQLCNIV